MTVVAPQKTTIPRAKSISVVAPKPEVDAPVVPVNAKKTSSRGPTTPIGPSSPSTPSDPTDERVPECKYRPGKWDVFLLGITIVIGGQYFCWNAGLAGGLYTYLIAYLLIASAYITLCCCTSEITGALPFAGGAYGLARCTLGFFPAFLIGCCEVLEYIAYVSSSVLAFVDMVVLAQPALDEYRPLVWALFYMSALAIQVRGDRAFWLFNLVLALVSLAILLLYCFGALAFVDFAANAADPTLTFVDGFAGFMKVLPLAAWFFVGVEALNLASDQVAQPKQMVPFGQVVCVLFLFVSGIMVFFVTVSLPPGLATLPSELVPFNNCFMRLFTMSHNTATVLSLPATYATAFGFMWCYGKLIAAMATSRLLPPALAKTSYRYGTPVTAVSAGSTLSYSLCLLVYWAPSIGRYLFSICIVAGFMSYSGQCIGYVMLKLSYRNIKSSQFRSPFGLAGALYSFSVWVLSIVAIAAFQGNGGIEILAFLTILALLSIFYYSYSRKRQTFSAQENRVLLVAHVTKFNARRIVAGQRAKSRTHTGSAGSRHTSRNAKIGTEASQFEAAKSPKALASGAKASTTGK